MRALLIAFGFLTRIPIPASVFRGATDTDQARALAWYPLVGAVLGALLSAIAWALHDVQPLLRGALVLVAWVALTGGMHLDGLADSADAWIGGMGDRARTLAIMHDPQCGPAGVTAIVLLLVLELAALTGSTPFLIWAVWLAPLLARASVVGLILTTPYARPAGLGLVLRRAPRTACVVVALATCAVTAGAGWPGGWALLATCAVTVLWRRAGLRRIGGWTGDTAGALIELTEVTVLIVTLIAHQP